jgi:hypothetical protein
MNRRNGQNGTHRHSIQLVSGALENGCRGSARTHIDEGRTIKVEQQVKRDSPEIVKYLKTNASKREVGLHPDVAEYLRQYTVRKSGLLFQTANGTPHLYGNLEDHWLTLRLKR